MAREVFLERGIRATTLEVAHRAGVSEGSLFHRFKTKEALFRAAMRFDEEELPLLLSSAIEKLDGSDVRKALLQFAHDLIELSRVALPLMMMSWSNPTDGVHPLERRRVRFMQQLKQFAAYCERQMDVGTLRRMDAEVFARAFMGSVHQYCLSRILGDQLTLPEGMYLRGLVDLFLVGALAEPARQVPARRAPRSTSR
ncbi:MAG: helix-turn-helix domain-containing protein [Polyangiaceae bacterium]